MDTPTTFRDYLVDALADHIKEHGNEIDLVIPQGDRAIVWVDKADNQLFLLVVHPCKAEIGAPSS